MRPPCYNLPSPSSSLIFRNLHVQFFEHMRPPPGGGRGRGPSRSMQTKALKAEVHAIGHRTGLPPKLLELFHPGYPIPPGAEIKKRPPKLPMLGLAKYVDKFASPGDSEYEPERPSSHPPSPRRFGNPELAAQARIDKESKIERCNHHLSSLSFRIFSILLRSQAKSCH